MFHPSEPVENSFGLAVKVRSPIATLISWACCRNSSRVMGQVVFAMFAPGAGRTYHVAASYDLAARLQTRSRHDRPPGQPLRPPRRVQQERAQHEGREAD